MLRGFRRRSALALGAVLPLLALASAVGAEGTVEVIGERNGSAIVTVRPRFSSPTRQGLSQFVGISGANSGARGLSLNRVVIPPAAAPSPIAIWVRNRRSICFRARWKPATASASRSG